MMTSDSTLGASSGSVARSLVEELVCPSCSDHLQIVEDYSQGDSFHAVVSCGCRLYPIVENILNLGGKYGYGIDVAIDHLRNGRINDAALSQVETELLNPTITKKVLRELTRKGLMTERVTCWYRAQEAVALLRASCFTDAIDALEAGSFGNYLKNRYALPSFFAALPLCSLLPGDEVRRIVDLGCGAGHYEYVLSSLYPQASIVAVDQFFANLLIASRFQARRQVLYVCMNLAQPSLVRQPFDLLFTSDTFHTLSIHGTGIASYLQYLKPEGYLLAPRVDQSWDKPFRRSLDDWNDLLPDITYEIFGEREIIHHVVEHDALHLGELKEEQTLSDCRSTCFVGSRERDVLALGKDNLSQYLTSQFDQWQINPGLVKSTEEDESLAYRMEVPPHANAEEWKATVMPLADEVLRLPKDKVNGNLLHQDTPNLNDLMRRCLATLPGDHARL